MCLFIISFGDLRFFLFDYFIALCSLYTCTPLALYYYQLLWHKQFLFFVDFFPFDRTLSIFCIMSFGSNNKTCAMSSKTFVQALGFIIFDFLAISIDDMVCTVFNSCANFPSMLAIYNNKWEWIIFSIIIQRVTGSFVWNTCFFDCVLCKNFLFLSRRNNNNICFFLLFSRWSLSRSTKEKKKRKYPEIWINKNETKQKQKLVDELL